MKKLGVFLVVLLIGFMHSAFAQEPVIVTRDKPGWYKIGEVKADFKMETESIAILGMDKFKSIKLKFTDAPINLKKVIVYYEPGEAQEIPVNGTFQAGAETGVFNLSKPAADLKKVSFTYKSEPNFKGDKAHVELYGLK
jgi:hypothetical protein